MDFPDHRHMLADDAGPSELSGGAVFRVEVHPERDAVRVAPIGELDLASRGELDRRLAELCQAGFRQLVLDLRGLTFIDSTGLHLIIGWDAYARENGLELALIQGPSAVERVFEITGARARLPFR